MLAALLAYCYWLHLASELLKSRSVIPGPKPWPVIGSLHLMANFKKYPFEALTKLQQVRSWISLELRSMLSRFMAQYFKWNWEYSIVLWSVLRKIWEKSLSPSQIILMDVLTGEGSTSCSEARAEMVGFPSFLQFIFILYRIFQQNISFIILKCAHISYDFSAIAFCDFDKLQVARRKILKEYTFPNAGGDMWAKLDRVKIILCTAL